MPSRWSTDAIPQRPVVLSTTRRRPHPSARASLPPSQDSTPDPSLPTPLLSRCPRVEEVRRRSERRGGVLGAVADPAMTVINEGFLKGNTNLTGTLRVGPAVQTIGARAFAPLRTRRLDRIRGRRVGGCARHTGPQYNNLNVRPSV